MCRVLLSLCVLISLGAGCASTLEPRPELPAPVTALTVKGFDGAQAQRLLNDLAPALPLSASFVGLLDLKALRAYTDAQNLSSQRSTGRTFWSDWSDMLLARYGLAPTNATALGVVNFGEGSTMFYVHGVYDAAALTLQTRMIRGRSFFVLKTKRGLLLMTNAPGGYFIFPTPGDAQAWVSRKQTTAAKLSSWARLSDHPSSVVHVAASSSWKGFQRLAQQRAATLAPDSMHAWVEGDELKMRVEDDNEGTLAAWRVVMDTLKSMAPGAIEAQRQRMLKRKAPTVEELMGVLALTHWAQRAAEQMSFTQGDARFDIAVPNPLADASFKEMLLAGLILESTERMSDSTRAFIARMNMMMWERKMQEFWIQTGQATCSLPEPVTLTPALGEVCACKDRLNGCPTASNLWQQKGWKQLNLQKDGSDGYHYALERDGDRLWMIMRQDADCDGVYATWRRSARVVKADDDSCSLEIGEVYSRNLDERP